MAQTEEKKTKFVWLGRVDYSESTCYTNEPHAGDLCPRCMEEIIDYDGLLNLSCPRCGTVSGGCFT